MKVSRETMTKNNTFPRCCCWTRRSRCCRCSCRSHCIPFCPAQATLCIHEAKAGKVSERDKEPVGPVQFRSVPSRPAPARPPCVTTRQRQGSCQRETNRRQWVSATVSASTTSTSSSWNASYSEKAFGYSVKELTTEMQKDYSRYGKQHCELWGRNKRMVNIVIYSHVMHM